MINTESNKKPFIEIEKPCGHISRIVLDNTGVIDQLVKAAENIGLSGTVGTTTTFDGSRPRSFSLSSAGKKNYEKIFGHK